MSNAVSVVMFGDLAIEQRNDLISHDYTIYRTQVFM